jgi:hypothetical protein
MKNSYFKINFDDSYILDHEKQISQGIMLYNEDSYHHIVSDVPLNK